MFFQTKDTFVFERQLSSVVRHEVGGVETTRMHWSKNMNHQEKEKKIKRNTVHPHHKARTVNISFYSLCLVKALTASHHWYIFDGSIYLYWWETPQQWNEKSYLPKSQRTVPKFVNWVKQWDFYSICLESLFWFLEHK